MLGLERTHIHRATPLPNFFTNRSIQSHLELRYLGKFSQEGCTLSDPQLLSGTEVAYTLNVNDTSCHFADTLASMETCWLENELGFQPRGKPDRFGWTMERDNVTLRVELRSSSRETQGLSSSRPKAVQRATV